MVSEKKNKGILRGEKEVNLSDLISGFYSITPPKFDEVLEREVINSGNIGKISVPAKHIGKKVKVYILSETKEGDKKEES